MTKAGSKRPSKPPKAQFLTRKRLAELAGDDEDTPSFGKFLLFEAIEWIFIAAILFVLFVVGRTIVENLTGIRHPARSQGQTPAQFAAVVPLAYSSPASSAPAPDPGR